jgi:hypothetical protein
MAPFDVLETMPKLAAYGIYFLLGTSFGSILELSGFGDSRKLSGQFYLRDMTVLKVMFTAIITACVLLYLGNSLGLIAFERVYVNHTYLWPGIVGGLIMGVGFIVGGFCPGTSIVALATLKIDGVFFAVGVSLGTPERLGRVRCCGHGTGYVLRFGTVGANLRTETKAPELRSVHPSAHGWRGAATGRRTAYAAAG